MTIRIQLDNQIDVYEQKKKMKSAISYSTMLHFMIVPVGFSNPSKEWMTIWSSPLRATAELLFPNPTGGSMAVRQALTRFSTSSHCNWTGWPMLRLSVSTASNQSVRSNSDDSRKVYWWLALLLEPFGLKRNFSGKFGESNKSLASREANFFLCFSKPAVERSNWVLAAAACDLLNIKNKYQHDSLFCQHKCSTSVKQHW